MVLVLYVLLGLSVLVDLALGAWASVAWESFLDTWLPNLKDLEGTRASDVRLLGLVLGFCLFCFAALQLLAIRWIRQEKEEGHQAVILFGAYLIVSSAVVYLMFQRPEFLLIDGIRGAALAILGVVMLNEPATVRELRLPKEARGGSERRRRGARTGRTRGGDSGAERRAGRERTRAGRTERRSSGRHRETRRGRDSERPGRSRRAEEKKAPVAEEPAASKVDLRKDSGRAESEPERTRRVTRNHLRPLVTGSAKTGNADQESADSPRTRRAQRSRRRGGSKRQEEDERSGAVRVENRSRTAQELIYQDPDAGRRSRRIGEENPLAVVVKGGLEEPRSWRSEEKDSTALDSVKLEPSLKEERTKERQDARRRRRTRRPLQSSRVEDAVPPERTSGPGAVDDDRTTVRDRYRVADRGLDPNEDSFAPHSDEGDAELTGSPGGGPRVDRPGRGPRPSGPIREPGWNDDDANRSPKDLDDERSGGIERKEQSEQGERHSAANVEALDMLSLLEPGSEETRKDRQPFGRTRRPASKRRRTPSSAESVESETREAPEPRTRAAANGSEDSPESTIGTSPNGDGAETP